MPLKLDIERLLAARSERVKSVDIHPKEPWILTALYSGHVLIWNYETEVAVRTFEICDVPVRCAKFITRKNWFVSGSDDMMIRVFNYNTHEKIKEFEAHSDYIRSVAVHPTLPYVLSGSDDMSIKCWDWDRDWENTMIFEGHTHYVMQLEINPKDPNTFASASLDRSVKVWGFNSSEPHFSLNAHERGVNCVSYYPGGERPFLVSGADDNLVKVWDYQTKACVATLEGHTTNISAVMFHPQLPVIISGSEDGSVRIWHSTTYRLETTVNYAMERVWALGGLDGSNKIAIGFDEGTVLIQLGQEDPVVSMDRSGKVIWARNHEIELVNVLRVARESIVDGEILSIAPDDLGSCEFYPSTISHNKNGRLVAVCGDGEYTIYTALRLKNKSFGRAAEFVWGETHDKRDKTDVYATKDSASRIKMYKNFEESESLRPDYQIQNIFGGYLLGVTSSEFIDFYDWDAGRIIRRIEVTPDKVYWSEGGTLVVLCCDDTFYVLNYNQDIVEQFIERGIETDEQGIEPAFEIEQDMSETVTSGVFAGEIFVYTNSAQRLNYYVGGQVVTLAHLDKQYWVLGYLQKENRVYLIDKQHNVISFELLRYVLAYQAAIVRGDFDLANQLLERGKIPEEYHNRLARFLENQGQKELALEVSKDAEHRFELALQLRLLELAERILHEAPSPQKWKQLGDLAVSECDFALAEVCAHNGEDFGCLLLLYTSTGNREALLELAKQAQAKSRFNIAFTCYYLLNRVEDCINLLLETNRVPEAAFMARAYDPERLPELVKTWKEKLIQISPTAAEALADPAENPEMFPTLMGGASYQREEKVDRDDVFDEEEPDKLEGDSGVMVETPSEPVRVPSESKPDDAAAATTDEFDVDENTDDLDIDEDMSLPSDMDGVDESIDDEDFLNLYD